ncbi:AI-2E family transporter [Pandoraea sp. ISTKB]|uniref:AI-2E family transporter n=1 Tax=Pandoraea sp. ISTKB TaxID=1586708 RepID=UPI00084686D5|nr:AI-2E family transporter [Pandoraea sp. ISTKB]ODP32268.1 AI-2E family transporter [Pandoraea sp. ISTKB]
MKQDLITCTCVLIIVTIVGWTIHVGRSVVVPIAFAVIVTYIVFGLAEIFRYLPHVGRRLRSGVRYGSAALLIVLVAWLGVDLLLADTNRMVAVAPRYEATLLVLLSKAAVLLHIETEPTWAAMRREILGAVNLQALLTTLIGSVSSIIATIVLVLLYAGFFLVEHDRFRQKLLAVMHRKPDFASVIDDINARIGTYLALKALLGAVLGVLSWICMRVVGLEFAGPLAVLIVVLNFVPYAGALVSVALPTLLALLQFGSWNEPTFLLISLGVLNFLVGNLLDPWLMGGSMNLSASVILMSLAVWGAIWGVAGAFLAVPGTVAFTIICAAFEPTRPLATLLTRDAAPPQAPNPSG